MKTALLSLLFISLSLSPFEGFAKVQDSIATSVSEIRYDKTLGLQTPEFSKETLEEFKNDRAFDYSEKHEEENWWQQFKSWLWELWLKFWQWLVGDYQANGFVAFLVHTLPYLIIAAIVFFIGWLFYKLNPGATLFASNDKPELFFSDEEEIIRSKDISELIDNALTANDYRLAIRYSYLLILQKLTEAEIIIYESDKTNSEYISEISRIAMPRDSTLKSGFQKATNLYDHVWYGNFEVTEADFAKAKPTFSDLKTLISKTGV